jgi:sterol desaturase/sphingolipid hydroxylase (fatty acid hydroxylase superfamily)
MTSFPPPAAFGTTKVIGRVGQSCAALGTGTTALSANPIAIAPIAKVGLLTVGSRPDLHRPSVMMEHLQIVVIVLSVSFFRYWMHRLQHTNSFLWELHSYHHRTTDLKALSGGVSNPVDFG